jgi:AcrR family transcriptional regulator
LPRVVPTYREEAKKRILQATLEVFKEKGYFRSTMDDIADRLGISKGAIYQYFDSKERLLVALYTGAPANLRARFTAETGKDMVDASKGVFNKMATKANANLFVDFLAEASRNVEFQKVLRENIAEFARVLEDILLEDNQKAGREEVERIHDAVVTLGLVFNGLSCWLAVGVPEEEVQATWAKTVETVLGPIGRRRRPAGRSKNQPDEIDHDPES